MFNIPPLANICWTLVCAWTFWMHRTMWIPAAEWWITSLSGPSEEMSKSIVREIFAFWFRLINGVSAFFVSVFLESGYRSSQRDAWRVDASQNSARPESTLNALVGQMGSNTTASASPSGAEAPEATVPQTHGPDTSTGQAQPRTWAQFILGGFFKTSYKSAASMNATSMQSATAQVFKSNAIPLSAVNNASGFVEESRIHIEEVVTLFFEYVRWTARRVCLIPTSEHTSVQPSVLHRSISGTLLPGVGSADVAVAAGMNRSHSSIAISSRESRSSRPKLRKHARSHSVGHIEDLGREGNTPGVITAADLIRKGGYPVEVYQVSTTDDYILVMERIPRPTARQAVFFIHGVMDTSQSWVCSGVTGSQAFAAWDAGYDVWLGNSRSNPPRLHKNMNMGSSYYNYTVNEFGLQDMQAQIDHIHNIKCTELGAGTVNLRLPKPRQSFADPGRSQMSQNDRKFKSLDGRSDPVSSKKGLSSWRSRAQLGKATASETDLAQLGASPSKGSLDTPIARTCVPPLGSAAGEATNALKLFSDRQIESIASSSSHASLKSLDNPSPRSSGPTSALSRSSRHNSRADIFNSLDAVCENKPATTPNLPTDFTPLLDPADPEPTVQSSSSLPSDDAPPPSRALNLSRSSFPDSLRPRPTSQSNSTPSPISPRRTLRSVRSVSDLDHTPSKSTTPSPFSRVQRTSSWLPYSNTDNSQMTPPFPLNRKSDKLPEPSPWRTPAAEWDPGLAVRVFSIKDSTRRSRQSAAVVSPSVLPQKPCSRSRSNPITRHGNARRSFMPSPTKDASPPRSAQPPPAVQDDTTSTDTSSTHTSPDSSTHGQDPYRLTAVGHSLGGAALLMYTVTSLRASRPHHLSRLVLLTPAGFITSIPKMLQPIAPVLPAFLRWLNWMWPAVMSAGFQIHSQVLRSMLFKLNADLKHVPALSRIVRSFMKSCMNGDSSDWDRAMQMPHYNSKSMPAVSLLQGLHMLQWIRTKRFQLFDYGDRDSNIVAYEQPEPPDIANNYWRLDIPVDIAAGRNDGIIPPASVKKHYYAMQAAGVKNLTYREFNFGHLDFTFAAKEELRDHVLNCLGRQDGVV